jgi:hypothetical protein
MLSTIKLHNFLKSTTSISMLVVFLFEVVFEIQIFKFLNSDIVFVDKMTSSELQNFITSQDLQSLFWLFGHLFTTHDDSNVIHKAYTSLL